MRLFRTATSTLLTFLTLGILWGCSESNDGQFNTPDVRMNQVQYLGTHNSYHIAPRPDVFDLLLAFIPDVAPTLAYTHVPLTQQFDEQGIRQIELDVFDDPQGGLYAERKALSLFDEPTESGIAELDEPGLKVIHVQEIDYETTCYTFVSCLEEIKAWSDNNPNHLPITILVEAKDEAIPDPLNLGFAIPLPFETAALNRIDEEVRSVFPQNRLILPDDVRGGAATLESAVLNDGWPSLSWARGKVMFALDNGGEVRDMYIDGHPSLAGRVMFTDSPSGTAEAAFMKKNNPLSSPGEIAALVEQGYIVRTRADADTTQSRENDTTQREAALASGAQFISTDYPVPNLEFSSYQVTIPGGGIARCNPVNTGECIPEAL